MKRIALYVLPFAALVPATLQAQNAQRPAPAQPAKQQQQVQIQTVPQICRIREGEIVRTNLQILQRNRAANQEQDQAKRNALLEGNRNLVAALQAAEASWNRMDCARILYNAR